MKILYITNGFASSLHTGFEVARRLVAAGHEVIFLSPAAVGDTVRAQGFVFEELNAAEGLRRRAAASPSLWSSLPNPLRMARWLIRRRRIRRESLANDEIESKVRRLGADLLLIDIEMHYAILATASLGLPTLLPMVFFTIFRHPTLPPLHRAIAPPEGPSQRLAIRVAWWRLRLETLHMEWSGRLHRLRKGDFFPPVPYDSVDISDLRALARRRRFPLSRETSRSHWLRPHVYRRLPILCLNAFEMELPHEPAANLHYVGPMVHRQRREVGLDSASEAAWRRYLETRQADRPLVYCSLGSYWSADRDFLRRVLQVFTHRTDWDLVLGLGGKLAAEVLEPIPGNALVLPWAPQLQVLEHASAAIVHGGVTTLQECTLLEVPMLIYSTGHVEQHGNSIRAAHHGLGLLGDKDQDGPEAMETRLEQVLREATYRKRLAVIATAARRYEKDRILEKLVDSFSPESQGPA